MVKPSHQREMMISAVSERDIGIRQAYELPLLSVSCYLYEKKLSSDNEIIANWLLRLANTEHRILVYASYTKCERIAIELFMSII